MVDDEPRTSDLPGDPAKWRIRDILGRLTVPQIVAVAVSLCGLFGGGYQLGVWRESSRSAVAHPQANSHQSARSRAPAAVTLPVGIRDDKGQPAKQEVRSERILKAPLNATSDQTKPPDIMPATPPTKVKVVAGARAAVTLPVGIRDDKGQPAKQEVRSERILKASLNATSDQTKPSDVMPATPPTKVKVVAGAGMSESNGEPATASPSPPPRPRAKRPLSVKEDRIAQVLGDTNPFDMTGWDLSGIDLRGKNFENMIFSDAKLGGANLSGVSFKGAQLNGADLSEADLSGANLAGANLMGAELSSAKLSSAFLKGAQLHHANLSNANLSKAFLKGAQLHGANLSKAFLKGADLEGANLKEADLTDANLVKAILLSADLTRTQFVNANLTDANLKSADLVSKMAGKTDFSGATLTRTNFAGARFGKVHLVGVDAHTAIGLTQTQLDAACCDSTTRLPAGLRNGRRCDGD